MANKKKEKAPLTDADLKAIEDLMAVGASKTEVAAELGISRQTLYDWCDPKSPRYDQVFSDTIKRGVERSEAWWEAQGRKNLENPKFNYTGWYMNMKNRFGWKDKQEVSTSVDLSEKLQELIANLPA